MISWDFCLAILPSKWESEEKKLLLSTGLDLRFGKALTLGDWNKKSGVWYFLSMWNTLVEFDRYGDSCPFESLDEFLALDPPIVSIAYLKILIQN